MLLGRREQTKMDLHCHEGQDGLGLHGPLLLLPPLPLMPLQKDVAESSDGETTPRAPAAAPQPEPEPEPDYSGGGTMVITGKAKEAAQGAVPEYMKQFEAEKLDRKKEKEEIVRPIFLALPLIRLPELTLPSTCA